MEVEGEVRIGPMTVDSAGRINVMPSPTPGIGGYAGFRMSLEGYDSTGLFVHGVGGSNIAMTLESDFDTLHRERLLWLDHGFGGPNGYPGPALTASTTTSQPSLSINKAFHVSIPTGLTWTNTGSPLSITDYMFNYGLGTFVDTANTVYIQKGTPASTGTALVVDNRGSGNSFEVRDQYTGSPLADTTPFVIDEDGNVGIGGTAGVATPAPTLPANPTHKLEVYTALANGSIVKFHNWNNLAESDVLELQGGLPDNPGVTNDYIIFKDGEGDVIGQIEGKGANNVGYVTTSDSRLKTNVRDYTDALDVVLNARPVIYNSISNPDGADNIGFIAQELAKVYPYAVSGDPDSDVEKEPMSVEYGILTPLLTRAIQELKIEFDTKMAEKNAEIEALKEILCELKPQAEICNQ